MLGVQLAFQADRKWNCTLCGQFFHWYNTPIPEWVFMHLETHLPPIPILLDLRKNQGQSDATLRRLCCPGTRGP